MLHPGVVTYEYWRSNEDTRAVCMTLPVRDNCLGLTYATPILEIDLATLWTNFNTTDSDDPVEVWTPILQDPKYFRILYLEYSEYDDGINEVRDGVCGSLVYTVEYPTIFNN